MVSKLSPRLNHSNTLPKIVKVVSLSLQNELFLSTRETSKTCKTDQIGNYGVTEKGTDINLEGLQPLNIISVVSYNCQVRHPFIRESICIWQIRPNKTLCWEMDKYSKIRNRFRNWIHENIFQIKYFVARLLLVVHFLLQHASVV